VLPNQLTVEGQRLHSICTVALRGWLSTAASATMATAATHSGRERRTRRGETDGSADEPLGQVPTKASSRVSSEARCRWVMMYSLVPAGDEVIVTLEEQPCPCDLSVVHLVHQDGGELRRKA
jgi:hypothetical protein